MSHTRVLIVEDEAATREGLSELLRGAGYEPVALDSFEAARRLLRTAPPDLLITDVRLGDYNGLHLLITGPRSVPAIVISGFADPVLEQEARRHGAAYLLKPVNPAMLMEVIREKTGGAPL